MGINDRDYMQESNDASGDSDVSSRVEDALTNFLQKYPRALLYLTIGIAALIAIALAVANMSNAST